MTKTAAEHLPDSFGVTAGNARDFRRPGPELLHDAAGRATKPNRYLLGSYRIATAPEPNSSWLTSFKSTRFDSPANNVGPCPTTRGGHHELVFIDQSQLRQRQRERHASHEQSLTRHLD